MRTKAEIRREILAIKLGVAAVWLLMAFALSFWTDRNMDHWASFAKGESVDVPGWLSFVASLPIPIALPVNILCEVLRYFV